jgi:tetratricopeptide (TPR) repeat protein
MKVVHSNRNFVSAKEWLERGKENEAAENFDDAAAAYEKIIKAEPFNEGAYNRLMIIYRKQKEYEKELAVIKKGISVFEDHHNPLTKKHTGGKKVTTLSKSIMKATGLLDKKGKPSYLPEPIGKWMKRKVIVEKRIGK